MVYFPEPATPDESAPTWDENAVDYYRRSTTAGARAVRNFLNRTLAHFPEKDARSLAAKLRQNWQSFYFEMVVGRYLQVLGAQVQPNAKGNNGTDVDYRAVFPDSVTISVECVSKRYNKDAQAEAHRHGNMATMLDAVGPHNWAIHFEKLPDANSAEQFQPYVDQAQAWYATLPQPVDDGPRLPFEWTGEHGTMRLEAIPFPRGTRPNHLGASVGWMDDSIQRLRAALIDSHKRKQAQGAFPPVFLAIDSPQMWGPDAEDFDQALFGQSVDHRGFNRRESVGVSFNPNGLLVTDRGIPYAGVIAFLGMSMVGAKDPVLYLNPYQRWKLPAALAAHEQRVWTSRIDRTPATRPPVINDIGFTEYPPDED